MAYVYSKLDAALDYSWSLPLGKEEIMLFSLACTSCDDESWVEGVGLRTSHVLPPIPLYPISFSSLQTSRRALHLAPMARAHPVPSRVPVAVAAVVLAVVAGPPPSRPRSQRRTPVKCLSVAFLQTSTKVKPRVIFTAAIVFQWL